MDEQTKLTDSGAMPRLLEKIRLASRSIGRIEKNGYNAHFKFKYQSWDDVLPATRSACEEHGLWVVPRILGVEYTGNRVCVNLSIEVTDGHESIVLNWFGEASSSDDKAINKATTSAYKYAVLKLFMIPAVDDVDPDGESDISQKPVPGPKRGPDSPRDYESRMTVTEARAAIKSACGLGDDEWKAFWAPFHASNVSVVDVVTSLGDRTGSDAIAFIKDTYGQVGVSK
jgi:hypothetical protein